MNNTRELLECLKNVQGLLSRATAGLDIESNAYLVEEALATINECLKLQAPLEMKKGWVKFPFGKHRGKPIQEVIDTDPEYFEWFVYKSGIDPRGILREAISEYLVLNGGEALPEESIDCSLL